LIPVKDCDFSSVLFNRKVRQEKKRKGHKEKKMVKNESANKIE